MYTVHTLYCTIPHVYSVNINITPQTIGINMNHLIKLTALSIVFFAVSTEAADMKFETKENIMFKGKISNVKTSKKYTNVEACQALCESRNSCVAFTLDTSKGSCTILKNVSREVSDSNSTSCIKN